MLVQSKVLKSELLRLHLNWHERSWSLVVMEMQRTYRQFMDLSERRRRNVSLSSGRTSLNSDYGRAARRINSRYCCSLATKQCDMATAGWLAAAFWRIIGSGVPVADDGKTGERRNVWCSRHVTGSEATARVGCCFAQIGSWNSTDGSLAIYDDATNETSRLAPTHNVTYRVTTIKVSLLLLLIIVSSSTVSRRYYYVALTL